MRILIVLGTRPEIIKLAPLIKTLGKSCSVAFTGQHFDHAMGMGLIDQLGLPAPYYSLRMRLSDPALQVGRMITRLSDVLEDAAPDSVLVQGDTNTVLAAGICSVKHHVPISHVEAGLRSRDWRMPEEHNRIAIDHLSELLFAPTGSARDNLTSERVHGSIHVTGNTALDSIRVYSGMSKRRSSLPPQDGNYILMTLHRSENVDHSRTLSEICRGVMDSGENVVFPVHPRTRQRLRESGLLERLSDSGRVRLLDPQGYFEMLELMKHCSFILTDSGGLQEEATSPVIRKKVLVLRKTTDRPEAVDAGLAEMVRLDRASISGAIKDAAKNPRISSRRTPYGDGHACRRIVRILRDSL